MAKSPKNRRPRRPRSRSPQVNDGSPRTPPVSMVQSAAGRVVAETVSTMSTGMRRIFDSGSKVVLRNKNRDLLDTVQQDSIATVQQGSIATVQQDDMSTMIQQDDTSTTIQQDVTSMTVNTPSINTPDGSNSGNNAGQEYGTIDVLRDASFLSDLGSRASQVEMNTMDGFSPNQGQNLSPSQDGFSPVQDQNLSPSQDGFSPVQGQNLSPSQSASPSDVNLSSPPRSSPSGNDNITMTGMDLLNTQDASANNNSVVGTLIPAPSPRRSTQSPVTHQLQQTLRNNAHEQVNGFNYSSPACSGDGNGGTSAFSTFNTNSPTIMETVQEGSSMTVLDGRNNKKILPAILPTKYKST